MDCKLKISIIGPGKVGFALGEAFYKAGYKIVAVVSRNKSSATRLMKITNCDYWTNDAKDVVPISDIILITTPDDEIEKISNSIYNLLGDKIIIHTSGTLSSKILKAKNSVSIHPICSFVGNSLPKNTYFTVEGNVEIGEALVKSICCIPIVIKDELKPLYHSALNFGAAFFLTLLNIGSKILKSTGIENNEEIMIKLASSVLDNTKNFGIKKAFTGPIVRDDKSIIEKELSSIKKYAPQYLDIYKILINETKNAIQAKD